MSFKRLFNGIIRLFVENMNPNGFLILEIQKNWSMVNRLPMDCGQSRKKMITPKPSWEIVFYCRFNNLNKLWVYHVFFEGTVHGQIPFINFFLNGLYDLSLSFVCNIKKGISVYNFSQGSGDNELEIK